MTDAFRAACVSIDEDAEVWRVAFEDDEFNAERRLVLQRGKTPPAEDVELGLDGYQVELDDPAQSCFGGIVSLELYPDEAVVELDEDTQAALGGEGVLAVSFALRPLQLAQLRRSLARIFEGDECFIDRCA